MPIHALTFTVADACSLVMAFLFLYQPGVDRKAVMQWLTDNVFGSSENFAAWGVFSSHKVVEWGGIGLYYLLYTLQIPFIEQFKTYPTPWPWNSKDKKKREEFKDLQMRAFSYVIKYHIVVFLFTLSLSIWAPTKDLTFVSPDAVPEWHVSAYQILVSTTIAEIGFYLAHRLLHEPTWYRYHKLHHEFKDCTVIATFYVHIVDSILTDFIPAGFGVFYFNMHWYTATMYAIPLIFNAMWVHCGYKFPSRINPFLVVPFATDSEEPHDLHHRENIYNFGGALFVMDRLLGTYKDPALSMPGAKKRRKAA